MQALKSFLETPRGRVAVIAAGILSLAFLYNSFRVSFGTSSAVSLSKERIFICSETGRSFPVTLEAGMPIPLHSPYSGKNTGYPAELCYWTAEGTVKSTPAAVLMNSVLGKKGATFCPDCHRLVVGHNPPAKEGVPPPLTEIEYQQKRASSR